jgi:hypothetical protein
LNTALEHRGFDTLNAACPNRSHKKARIAAGFF